MNQLKICIIGLKCYDHILGASVPRYLGGIETQLAVLARGLVRHCEVSLITYDHGQQDGEVFDGVRVLKSYPPEGGFPFLRKFHPRFTRLRAAMSRARADIYLQMGAGQETAEVALGARCLAGDQPRFVYCMASDTNFGTDFSAGRLGLEGRLYAFGLQRAGLIVAQTKRQQEGLRKARSLESVIIPMAVSSPPRAPNLAHKDKGMVLWVGRITPEKRLEMLLDVARRSPEINFEVVGAANQDSDYATRVLAEARQMRNVNVHGRLAANKLAALYRTASLLCCTSQMEGFPTTFLEAWANGMPVITTFDPDAVVERNQLGLSVMTTDDLVARLRDLLGDHTSYQELVENCVSYHARNHSVVEVSSQFCQAFERLMDTAGSARMVSPGHAGSGCSAHASQRDRLDDQQNGLRADLPQASLKARGPL